MTKPGVVISPTNQVSDEVSDFAQKNPPSLHYGALMKLRRLLIEEAIYPTTLEMVEVVLDVSLQLGRGILSMIGRMSV